MIIGRGTIKDRFIDYSLNTKYLIYIEGINNYNTCSDEELIYEENAVKLAILNNPDAIFVYFSSCRILNPNLAESSYVIHKIRIENLIQKISKNFWIFRLPQIIGLSNTNTSIINYLIDNIYNSKTFELLKYEERNLIDIDDVYDIVCKVLNGAKSFNKVINIASTHQTDTKELIKIIENFLQAKSKLTTICEDQNFEIDISYIKPILIELDINFNGDYIRTALIKYFGHLVGKVPLLSIIVPTYNEEHGIEEFYRRTKNILTILSPRFNHEIIFINDCSSDKTLQKLNILADGDLAVKIIDFSRNFGNQFGIAAGIDASCGDLAIVIDDDLQDPPEIIVNMIAKWAKGYHVVYGVRPVRKGINALFRLMAELYYFIISILSDIKIPRDAGDFRLIDKAVMIVLRNIREENLYYRGLTAWVGFRQIEIVYERDVRYAGVSTFSLKKYFNFALNGITSFSERPLYLSALVGLVITLIAFILGIGLVLSWIIDPSVTIRGWTSIIVMILFFGGIQLISIGILGIYIGKIFREVKNRPKYIVQNKRNI